MDTVEYLIPCKVYNIQHIEYYTIEEKISRLINFHKNSITDAEKYNLLSGKAFLKFICKRDTPRSNRYAEVYCKHICNLQKQQQFEICQYQNENPGQIVGEFSVIDGERCRGCLFTFDISEIEN
jgi:hypothetical protein